MNTYKLKFLIVGSGGRESAFAKKLAEDTRLYAVMSHYNPSIVKYVSQSNGVYHIGNSSDPQTVLAFSQKHNIDYVFVSADDPLANGVVDILLDNNIKAIGGTKAATRIEWDKVYSIEMMKQVGDAYTPHYVVVSSPEEVQSAINSFQQQGMEVVVKPQGLTGGKGVKVMPEHLIEYKDAVAYAKELLISHPNDKVLLVEKLKGIEFTIMGITDGENLVLCPASYDYPFRFHGDVGAGTGGMGCFTDSEKKLPFMSDQDLEDCKTIMERIIKEINNRNLSFNGILNGGFFKTKDGIKFMEFNSRFGDPEGLNILSVLKGSFSKLLIHLWNQTLSEDIVSFLPQASVVKYLVAKEYPLPSERESIFSLDTSICEENSVSIFFAACEHRHNNEYVTLKKSRVVALVALANTIEEASEKLNETIEKAFKGDLEYRSDIGSVESLSKLQAIHNSLEEKS